jgi:hypothetical protein
MRRWTQRKWTQEKEALAFRDREIDALLDRHNGRVNWLGLLTAKLGMSAITKHFGVTSRTVRRWIEHNVYDRYPGDRHAWATRESPWPALFKAVGLTPRQVSQIETRRCERENPMLAEVRRGFDRVRFNANEKRGEGDSAAV